MSEGSVVVVLFGFLFLQDFKFVILLVMVQEDLYGVVGRGYYVVLWVFGEDQFFCCVWYVLFEVVVLVELEEVWVLVDVERVKVLQSIFKGYLELVCCVFRF